MKNKSNRLKAVSKSRSDPQMTQINADVKNGMVMLKDSPESRKCWKEKCMPVLPKLAKRGVFGKNAILEMSPKTRDG